jgi:uncharacterized protein YlxW (UPF0749 family)
MKTKRTIREQAAWEMMIRAGKTKGEIILSPTLWFALGICWGLGIGHALASPLQHEFKSPSFNGINQSSHYLTVENQETSRKAAIKAEIEDLQKQLERDANNTTLAKFIRNVESRIYSTLSRQLVEQMFGENPSDSGSFDIEGTGITYVKDDDKVEMTITDEDGSTTVITVPIGDFGF